jgi:glucan phosphoethanolaminetransferase (alkaline phosphatase superfamily)
MLFLGCVHLYMFFFFIFMTFKIVRSMLDIKLELMSAFLQNRVMFIIIIIIIIYFNCKWVFTRWQWYYNETQHTNNTQHKLNKITQRLLLYVSRTIYDS